MAPGVDRLIGVTDDEEVILVWVDEVQYKVHLELVGILEFVYQKVFELLAVGVPDRLVGVK